MSRALLLAGMLMLAACHRTGAADVTLDADADARNATAAKTVADLAAADAAARTPLPGETHHARPKPAEATPDRADAPDSQPADTNDSDAR